MGIGLSGLIEKWGRGLGVGQWNSRLLPSGSLAKIEVPSGSSDSWNEAEFNERFSRFSPPSRRRVTVSLRGEVLGPVNTTAKNHKFAFLRYFDRANGAIFG